MKNDASMKTLYVGNDNTVMLTCPGCDRARILDVSKYLPADGPIKITYRFQCDSCRCGHASCQECIRESCALGHVNTVRIERRRNVRKVVLLSGVFTVGAMGSLKVKILDISRVGVRVEFATAVPIDGGTRGMIDFQLDDPSRTRIRKEVRVERHAGNTAVLMFQEDRAFSPADKAIGFYLMNNG